MPTISVFFESSWRKTSAMSELVPDPEQVDDRQRDERSAREREHDPAEDVPRGGAVDGRRLDQAPRDRRKKLVIMKIENGSISPT